MYVEISSNGVKITATDGIGFSKPIDISPTKDGILEKKEFTMHEFLYGEAAGPPYQSITVRTEGNRAL
ncbi:10328_t:CDS:2 [Funneliformis caledonium]|uniref:10328_t:CDS:1 n=1 Tax=Funneliformis caledonium TaxID=1117310 RepID=A0A9N9DC82_9GLOM|nr:10328_t:CDS:2 [Funneliformis caledonium]